MHAMWLRGSMQHRTVRGSLAPFLSNSLPRVAGKHVLYGRLIAALWPRNPRHPTAVSLVISFETRAGLSRALVPGTLTLPFCATLITGLFGERLSSPASSFSVLSKCSAAGPAQKKVDSLNHSSRE